MSSLAETHQLLAHEGRQVLRAAEAALKGALESSLSITDFVIVKSDSTSAVCDALKSSEVRELLRRARMSHRVLQDAGRAAAISSWLVQGDRCVVAMLAGSTAEACHAELTSLPALPQGGSLAIVLETSPHDVAVRPLLCEAGMPVLEVGSPESLRDAMEGALRLSRGAGRACVITVERHVMCAAASLSMRPNLHAEHLPAGPPRRSGQRSDDLGGPLRIARRLELNRSRALPSPGERAEVGFVTVGQADRSLRRLEVILGVERRLPTLHLSLVSPPDEAAMERLLLRCRTVVVLEPPGSVVETAALRLAARLTSEGQASAHVISLDSGESIHPYAGLHPSRLARELGALLQPVLSGMPLQARLSDAPPLLQFAPNLPKLGESGQVLSLRDVAVRVAQTPTEEEEHAEDADEPTRWLIDGMSSGPTEGRLVVIECWGKSEMKQRGAAAISQAAKDGGSWIMLVAAGSPPHGRDLERWIGGVMPAGAKRSRVLRRSGFAGLELQRAVRECSRHQGLSVIVVDDGPPARFDPAALQERVHDIDRDGYVRTRRIIWPADAACVIRQPTDLRKQQFRAVDEAIGERAAFNVDAVPLRWPPSMGAKIRPLVEQVEVTRTKPPRRGATIESLEQPEFKHANQPVWYASLAGVRGGVPGVVGQILSEAAMSAGYHVEWAAEPAVIGPGRRAGAHIVFSRPRDEHEGGSVPPVIPWGEADLLLGFDRGITLRAIDPQHPYRVAASDRTCIIANSGLFEEELDHVEISEEEDAAWQSSLEAVGLPDQVHAADMTAACRYRFHNERLADVALLGMAWQRGVVPLSLDAIQQGLQASERSGWARSREAFAFGRLASIDPAILQVTGDRSEEPSARSLRRFRLTLARERLGGREGPGRFRRLSERLDSEVPGLLETSAGRAAHRDLAMAVRRCVSWGGFDLAERFVDRIISLYRSDRADSGRALTRAAVLPLAEAMLIRDAIFIASMAISVEHRRNTRRRLNVRGGREDRISIRYLTRLEITLIRWRFRLDLRTSDWLVWALGGLRWLVPNGLRGRKSRRQVRAMVDDVILRAASSPEHEYDAWRRVLEMLHAAALDGRLQMITPQALENDIAEARRPV